MIQECIIIRTSADTFDFIVGHRLNDRPLSRAERGGGPCPDNRSCCMTYAASLCHKRASGGIVRLVPVRGDLTDGFTPISRYPPRRMAA
jgi:hypothetical protein